MSIITGRLSEKEVRERLFSCTNADVIDEIYRFGQMMLKETLEVGRVLDSKAAQLAAFGSAVTTLLVSTSGSWYRLGNRWTLLLAALAGLAGFIAAMCAAQGLALREFDWLGEKEWLEPSCFTDINKLKRYRALTIWGAMDSHKDAHLGKALQLRRAEKALVVSVFFLLLVLLQIALVNFNN